MSEKNFGFRLSAFGFRLSAKSLYSTFLKSILQFFVLILIIQPGCSDQNNETTAKPPQIQFHLTDFPLGSADIISLTITIFKIEVMQQNEEWLVVTDYGIDGLPVDLLQYQNGYTIEIGNFTLEPGDYKQMRFVISPDILVVENTVFGNTTLTVNTPSESFEYIKVLDEFQATLDNNAAITIDFDAQHSLHQEGDHYIFTPNVRLKSMETDGDPITLTPVSIAAQNLQPVPPLNAVITTDLNSEGLIALNSMIIGAGSLIESNLAALGVCDLTAQTACQGDDDDCSGGFRKICLDGSNEIHIGANVNQSNTYLVMGNRVAIGAGAIINGIVESNFLTADPSAIVTFKNTPLVSVPELPDFYGGYEGSLDITGTSSPLAAGIYENLTLLSGESMVLDGQYFHFEKITAGDNSSITCLNTCQIFVRKGITAGINFVMRSNLDSSNAMYIYMGELEIEHNIATVEMETEYFVVGAGAQIKANFYIPFGEIQIGDNSIYTGTLIAHKISIGMNSHIIGTPPSIMVSQPFIAEADYNGDAFQLEFSDNANMKMINNVNPNYVYHGTYQYNLATKIITFNYQTVDLIDSTCYTCRTTGIYPPIATYPVNAADIPVGYWGIEILDMTDTLLNARIISDGTLVTFNQRAGFGPYDSIF